MKPKEQEVPKSLEQQATDLLRKHGYDEWGTRIAESTKRKKGREYYKYLRKVNKYPKSA